MPGTGESEGEEGGGRGGLRGTYSPDASLVSSVEHSSALKYCTSAVEGYIQSVGSYLLQPGCRPLSRPSKAPGLY